MVDTATQPTDAELQTARDILAWLAIWLAEHNPGARVSIEYLNAAQAEIPSSIAELEGLD